MIVEYLKSTIFANCKQHSIKKEYLDGSHEKLINLIQKSNYELPLHLKEVRDDILSSLRQIYSNFLQEKKKLELTHEFVQNLAYNKNDIEILAKRILSKRIANVKSPLQTIIDNIANQQKENSSMKIV